MANPLMKVTYKALKDIYKNDKHKHFCKKGETLQLTPGTSWTQALVKTGFIEINKVSKPAKKKDAAKKPAQE